jgi:hypothetical protein
MQRQRLRRPVRFAEGVADAHVAMDERRAIKSLVRVGAV